MNALVAKYLGSSHEDEIRKQYDELEADSSYAMWGSTAGFGNLSKGIPTFNLPSVPDVRYN